MQHVSAGRVPEPESEAQKELLQAEASVLRNLQTLQKEVHRTVHEVSSPFQSIVCFLHIVRCRLEEGDTELGSRINDVISQSERINDLLRRITFLVDEAVKTHGSPGQVTLWQDAQLSLDLR